MTNPLESDPLAPLLELDGVLPAAQVAADDISAVHRHRVNLRKHGMTGAESVLRGARSSAVLAGGKATLTTEAGTVTDPVLAQSLRVYDLLAPEAVGETVRVWNRAPLQVLAKLATVSAPEATDAGRPRPRPDMPAGLIDERLHLLARMVTTSKVHGAVLAAVVHGELLTLAPFGGGAEAGAEAGAGVDDGMIARAAARLVLLSSGVDPRGLAVPEVWWSRSPEKYRELAAGFRDGGAEGVRQWILFHLQGLSEGAREARSIADAAG